MKATWCQINGEPKEIFKQPKTDNGMKNSLKGLILVKKDGNTLYAQDCVSVEEYNNSDSELKTVFKDGKLLKTFTLTEIRNNINSTL